MNCLKAIVVAQGGIYWHLKHYHWHSRCRANWVTLIDTKYMNEVYMKLCISLRIAEVAGVIMTRFYHFKRTEKTLPTPFSNWRCMDWYSKLKQNPSFPVVPSGECITILKCPVVKF